jgi:hypothetical protein
MMLELLGLIKYWRFWALLAGVAAVVGTVWYGVHHYDSLKTQVATDKTTIQTLQSANDQQKQVLQDCSNATAAMAASAASWEFQARAAQAQANTQSQVYMDKAKTILAKKPVAGVSDYDATVQLFNEAISELKK